MAGEWRQASIGALCDAGVAELQTGPFGTQLHAYDYVDDGVPVVPTEAIRGRQIDHSVLPKITQTKATELERHRLRPGDILFARRGVQATGHIGCVRKAEDGFICGTGAIRLRVARDSGAIDPDYLSHVLADPSSVQWFKFHAIGATMPNLNEGIIRSFPLSVPPLPEQRAIAHILGTLDDKIELNRRMNETLEAMARALFKSWFVDFDPVRAKAEGRARQDGARIGQPRKPLDVASDLPWPGAEAGAGAEGDPGQWQWPQHILDLFPARLVDSELGGIPEGWSIKSLGEICSRIAMGPFGSDIKTDNFVESGVPIVRGANLRDGFVDDHFVFLTEGKADSLKNANAFPGDIVITHRGTLGQVGLIPASSRFSRYVVSQSQMLLTVAPGRSLPRYVYMYLRSPHGQHALLANTSQTGVPAIARPTASVKAIALISPSKPVIETFGSIVEPLYQRLEQSTRESHTLAALRDALLPKLISGELRVNEAERVIKETTV